MLKKLKIFFLSLAMLPVCSAQTNTYLDSLRNQLNKAQHEDTFRVNALSALAEYYGFVQFDSSLYYANQEADLAEKLNFVYGKMLGYRGKFFAFNCTGNFPMALQQALNVQKLWYQLQYSGRPYLGSPVYFLGVLNVAMGDYPAAKRYFHFTIALQKPMRQPLPEIFFAFSQLGLIYLRENQLDSALIYAQQGYDLGAKSVGYKKFYSLAIGILGTVEVALQHNAHAEELFHAGIDQADRYKNIYFKARNYNFLAALLAKEHSDDSAIYYSRIALQICQAHNFAEFTLTASKLLSQIYTANGKIDSAFKYMNILIAAKDSVFNQSRSRQFSQLAYDEILSQQKTETEKERYQDKVRLYILLSALLIFFVIAVLLYRNNRQKQKAKATIESAYAELKSTQSQLIQSEKMASLGELTAGIAHEIQNPLNFVNNFSEVNKEMLMELNEEINNGNYDDAKSIAKDLIANEEKINHHGKRADAIVKGMLQHSRSSTGVKEPTNINSLADEYLRLSYHGLRAKEKDFNATIKTDFDESIGKINIIPQDIGRVLLNLYNNAFYAVNEKRKTSQPPEGGVLYDPVVTVSTKLIKTPSGEGGKVILTVMDNGNGISQKVIDKIFQPFFTTKPTGQGTGLGLSLSYDIVKAHRGEIKVETKEGEFTEFIIQLPIST